MKMNIIRNYCWWLFLIVLCCEGQGATNGNLTMQFEEISTVCSNNKLVVEGYDVKISSVLNAACFGRVTFIDVFALNNLFIDADFDASGQQVQLSLIAPIWVINGNKKITLNGKNAESHKSLYANDGIGSFRHGQPGKPGRSIRKTKR